ncbi:ThiF family adenylyltransferase [Planctomycetota bacterium]|nr:ThiF family adenylyltransferase [Planctomycetota bacterium]
MGFEIKVNSVRGQAPESPEATGVAGDASGKIRISADDLHEDRYHRLRLIGWWDQELLSKAVVVVAGAGALGNEALKNLALLGVRHLFVCDMDDIETSNLTRSVLFRLHDVGRHKAEVACERAVELNPDVRAIPIKGDLRFSLGLGLIRRADVVLGCLDNIAARVYLSRHAFRMGKTSIDAGLDTLNGDVYTFTPPEGPCYECRLKEADRKEFRRRQSCLKLTRGEVSGGKVPTAPTIAAIASGLQTQIAVRAIHGMRIPAGRRLGLYGMSDVFFDIQLETSEDCPAHGWMECLKDKDVVETPLSAATSTLDELLAAIREELGAEAYLSLDDDREIIVGLTCAECGAKRQVLALAGDLSEDAAACEACDTKDPMSPDVRAHFDGSEGLGQTTLADLGLPPLHIVRGREDSQGNEVLIELTGDLESLFGTAGAS